MKSGMIDQKLIQLDLEATDSEDFFTQISAQLRKLGLVKESFEEAIKSREREYPTAIPTEPYPIAIPHADPEHIIKPFIAFVRLKNPVQWREMTAGDVEYEIRFVIVLGFEQKEEHVKLLQILIDNFQKEDFIKELLMVHTEDKCEELLLGMKGLEEL